MKKVFTVSVISALIFINIFCSNNKSETLNAAGKQYSEDSTEQKKADTVWISCVGDLMAHMAQIKEAQNNNGYNFNYMFKAITPYTSFADLTLGNFETVTAGSEKGFTGYPTFNAPADFLYAIINAGFDVLTTANNHCLDRGFLGIERTIEEMDKKNVFHTGTFSNIENSLKTLIIPVKDIKIAVLAYTYGTNGINTPSGKEWSVNYINSVKMKKDTEVAKESGADIIIACVHWGDEYQRVPNKRQKEVAEELFDYGVDIIFGSHPHVIQPMEMRTITKNGKSKDVFIIWSMGNFISNQRKRYTDSGVIINIRLVRNNQDGETMIDKVDYVPTYVSTRNGFSILPVYESIAATDKNDSQSPYYSQGDITRLKDVYNETTNQLTNEQYGFYPFEGSIK